MRDINSSNPDEPSYWPAQLPPREKTRKVLRMLGEGYTYRQVHDATGVTTNRLVYMAARPEMWDTVDDEVAIERALGGDRTVLPALTLYERAAVRDALAERLEREPYEPSFQGNKPIHSSDHWLSILADQWGVSRRRLYNRLNIYNARSRRRAA